MKKVFVVTKHLVIYAYGNETKVFQYVVGVYETLESAIEYVEYATSHKWFRNETKVEEWELYKMTYTSPKEPSETTEGKEYAIQYQIEPTYFE